ncbi:EpsG family protein [Anaerococcus obesiensis]|uniref:EpsG family protein n=1 Tax=Anaerococcus obesiensis TaxID=1287640 RepID=A0A7T7UUR2_9FIRM|nr:EpsG family protein [Anaerococcus obesiensis]
MHFKASYSVLYLLLSFDFIKKNKKLVSLLLILLAVTFHKTAIFFLLSYLIIKGNDSRVLLIKKICF